MLVVVGLCVCVWGGGGEVPVPVFSAARQVGGERGGRWRKATFFLVLLGRQANLRLTCSTMAFWPLIY